MAYINNKPFIFISNVDKSEDAESIAANELLKSLIERSVTSIKIPEGVTKLRDFLFYEYDNLTNVELPSSLQEIGIYAFYNCINILKYDFTKHTSVPILGVSALNAINTNCKIYVPDSLYNEWIAATNWSSYASYIAKASEMV